MLVPEGLIGLHRTIQLQLLSVTGWGIGLDYHDIEWFVLGKNRDHSVVFEIAPKYCISDSLLTMREHNPQVWKCLVVKVKSDALKNNIA